MHLEIMDGVDSIHTHMDNMGFYWIILLVSKEATGSSFRKNVCVTKPAWVSQIIGWMQWLFPAPRFPDWIGVWIFSAYLKWREYTISQHVKNGFGFQRLVPWNIYDFPYIGNVIIPTDELIFFRGVAQPPTSFMFYVQLQCGKPTEPHIFQGSTTFYDQDGESQVE